MHLYTEYGLKMNNTNTDAILLGCDAVWICRYIFSPEDEESMFLQNVSIYLQIHKTSQPRRITLSYHHPENLKSHKCKYCIQRETVSFPEHKCELLFLKVIIYTYLLANKNYDEETHFLIFK
jgi:hypothetical protein